MTIEEHLEKIKAKCRESITLASQIEPVCPTFRLAIAGWKATIAAIDSCVADDPKYQEMYNLANLTMIEEIIAAWPEDILRPPD